MARSKLSTKALFLAASIGLSTAAFAESQPAAAQSYSYTCPDGFVYDPTYGCTLGGDDYSYNGYPTILYGQTLTTMASATASAMARAPVGTSSITAWVSITASWASAISAVAVSMAWVWALPAATT